MARTPDGPASAKPLCGLTGQTNLQAPTEYDYLQIPEEELRAKSFKAWLRVRKDMSYEALIAPLDDSEYRPQYINPYNSAEDDYSEESGP